MIIPLPNGSITSPNGFSAGTVSAEIKYRNRLDLTVITSDRDCTAAGIFTRNVVVAAPVTACRAALATDAHAIRAVVANAGVANACTGEPGLQNARRTQVAAAGELGCRPEQVLVLSTGVIGMQLPIERVTRGIAHAVAELAGDGGEKAARAIMTTDTVPKQAAVQVALSTGTVTVAGMAKGAGMIHPDMATMLAVMTTDAGVADPATLNAMLKTAADVSFNRISVDGDTSTNDTVLLLANGAAAPVVSDDDRARLQAALNAVCTQLAHMIVRDGEGATKFVALEVSGATSNSAAHQIANTIATSPLVKTALAGSDPNWGRIVAAAGRAGVTFDQADSALSISADGETWLQLLSGGTPTAYAEQEAAAIFAQSDIHIRLRVGDGNASATVWTCDLSHDYVTINADYRT